MKTILDIITKAGVEGPALIALLQSIVARFPNLAPTAQKMLDALSATTDPATLAALATDIIAELGQGAQLHFDGKEHPGSGF